MLLHFRRLGHYNPRRTDLQDANGGETQDCRCAIEEDQQGLRRGRCAHGHETRNRLLHLFTDVFRDDSGGACLQHVLPQRVHDELGNQPHTHHST